MSIVTKRGKWMILIALIVLTLFSIYTLKSGSEKFEILDINRVSSINNPALKTAIEVTEECNKLEAKYKRTCYNNIAWELGYYYENTVCENLNKEFKPSCYQGYGRSIGEKYSPDIKTIQDECSKTAFYEMCLLDAAIPVGKESAKHIETEQCQEFEREHVKQRCYEGIGRQLGVDNKEQSLCKKTNDEESCLIGFAYKSNRKEALQICKQLNEKNTERCYYLIGEASISDYNKTIEEAFKDCEQYTYAEECKQGVAAGIIIKFFEENQQKNETSLSLTSPGYKVSSTIDHNAPKSLVEIVNKTRLTIIEHTLICLIVVIIIARITFIINNQEENIKRAPYNILEKSRYLLIKRISGFIVSKKIIVCRKIAKAYRIAYGIIILICQKTIKICYNIKSIIRDLLTLDKTIISSLFKEIKPELKSKEGKKKLLLIGGIILSTMIGDIIITNHHINPALIFYFYKTSKNKKWRFLRNETKKKKR